MSRTEKTALPAAIASALLLCCIVGASCAQPVNMLSVNTPREALSVSDSALAGLVPPGYTVTDRIGLQLDGVGPREMAIVMCADDPSRGADWWLRYSGPSKVIIVSEADASCIPLGEFELKGCAPPGSGSLPAPFFTEDLNADGLPELFVRTKEYAGGSGGWTHVSLIKWNEGAFVRAGIFGVAEMGGMYLLDNWVKTPGSEVVLLHYVWEKDDVHFGPHVYRAQTYGWSNGYYVVLGEIYTNDRYDNPDSAFANLVRWVWNKGTYQRLPRGYY